MKKEKINLLMKTSFVATGIAFGAIAGALFLGVSIMFFCTRQGWVQAGTADGLTALVIQTVVISLLAGAGMIVVLEHVRPAPVGMLIQAIQEVARGNYDVKVTFGQQGEYKELSSSFNHMTEELSEVEMLRSDFIHNFSHEFKTPIVSIMGFAKLIKKGNLTPEQEQEYLDIIIEESERLSRLSSTVLDLSKVESMTLLTDTTTFSVSEQIREAVLMLEQKWNKKQISFEFEMEETAICANEALLKQVWVNLLDNAVKFSPVDGVVTVTLQKSGDRIVFCLKDNGPGITEDALPYIFDKFYQADTSRSTTGNGLGLPLVKKIVELHGGTVSAESESGHGSLFTVILPAGLTGSRLIP